PRSASHCYDRMTVSSRPPSVSQFSPDFSIAVPYGSLSRHDERRNAVNHFKRTLTIAGMTAAAIGLLLLVGERPSPAQSNDSALMDKAKAIHNRVIKIDTHNDIEPANFAPDCNYTMRLTTQVNLPKMVEGGMDVSFMIV